MTLESPTVSPILFRQAFQRLIIVLATGSFLPVGTVVLQTLRGHYGPTFEDSFTGFFWLLPTLGLITVTLAALRVLISPSAHCSRLIFWLACGGIVALSLLLVVTLYTEVLRFTGVRGVLIDSLAYLFPVSMACTLLLLKLVRRESEPSSVRPEVGPVDTGSVQQEPDFGGTPIARSEGSDTAVVFVHGVLSDGQQAWTHQSGTFWPKLLADETSLLVDIWNFTYRAALFNSTFTLNDVAVHLREFLLHEDLWNKRRLIFVAHSLGGVAVRRLVVAQQALLIQKQIEVGLFLLASPSRGSIFANMASALPIITGNPQIDVVRFEKGNLWLENLNEDFHNLRHQPSIRMFGKELTEDKPIGGVLVVDHHSAAVWFENPYKIPGSDHVSIAKPRSRGDLQHRALVNFIAKACGSSAPG